jgi:uncharacterized cupin superfamily protein
MSDWFVTNATREPWRHTPGWGRYTVFEREGARFPELGINVHVLDPGDVSAMYHGEDAQEDFLVLGGECLLIIEGQERRLRRWDFVHCPRWVRHAFVGTGDGPCAILMVGARRGQEDVDVLYAAEPAAARHGAAVDADTQSPAEAYVSRPRFAVGPYVPGSLPGG